MTIWVGNVCSHSFGIEKVGKPYFSFIFILTLEWDLQKGEYERNKTKHTKKNNKKEKKNHKNSSIYIQELKVRGIKQR